MSPSFTAPPHASVLPYQLVVGDVRPILGIQEPPGRCSHSGCTHVAYGGEEMGVGGAKAGEIGGLERAWWP